MPAIMALDLNLSLLACRAAIELDNLLLDRIMDFKAMPLLAETLKRIESSTSFSLDPGEALVLNRAIASSSIIAKPSETTDQLLKSASDIRGLLEKVMANPQDYKSNTEVLINLRAFCVELSKSAASYNRTMDEMEPKHPFRR